MDNFGPQAGKFDPTTGNQITTAPDIDPRGVEGPVSGRDLTAMLHSGTSAMYDDAPRPDQELQQPPQAQPDPQAEQQRRLAEHARYVQQLEQEVQGARAFEDTLRKNPQLLGRVQKEFQEYFNPGYGQPAGPPPPQQQAPGPAPAPAEPTQQARATEWRQAYDQIRNELNGAKQELHQINTRHWQNEVQGQLEKLHENYGPLFEAVGGRDAILAAALQTNAPNLGVAFNGLLGQHAAHNFQQQRAQAWQAQNDPDVIQTQQRFTRSEPPKARLHPDLFQQPQQIVVPQGWGHADRLAEDRMGIV